MHLAARDVTFVAVSRAPLAEIRPFRQRMGWRFKRVSSHGSDFNYDFHVSSTPVEPAKGRDEDGLSYTMAWVRHHDRYDEGDHHG